MSKQRIVGLLTLAAIVVIVLPFLRLSQDGLPPVKEMMVPKPPQITKRILPEIKNNKTNLLQEKAWSIQLASFVESANAEFLVQQLRNGGYSAYKQSFLDDNGKTFFRVYVGPLLSLSHAKRLKEQIQQNQAFQTFNGVILTFRPTSEGKYGEL